MAITRRSRRRSTASLTGGSGLAAEATTGGTASAGPASIASDPPVDIPDYARVAPARLSTIAREYLEGGAADELTLRWNREAYDRIRLKPRVLVDVSQIDTRVTLYGRIHACPILLAPVAYHKLAHPEGEVAAARGAAAGGATLVVSTSATTTLEDVAAAARQPLWFQLYVQRDRGMTRELIRRAEAAQYEALVVTVDAPVLGPRYRETRSKFALPPGVERANLRGLTTATGAHRANESSIYSALLNPALTWKEIDWLRSITKLPLLLKGILNPDDAALGVAAGVAGIIVSNHGGRNLDSVPASIEALPAVAAVVAGRVPVLVDGGIRRGTDVLKALALGASATLVGRAYMYGLAVGGADGVARVVTLLRRELEAAMALTGRPTIREIDASVIWK